MVYPKKLEEHKGFFLSSGDDRLGKAQQNSLFTLKSVISQKSPICRPAVDILLSPCRYKIPSLSASWVYAFLQCPLNFHKKRTRSLSVPLLKNEGVGVPPSTIFSYNSTAALIEDTSNFRKIFLLIFLIISSSLCKIFAVSRTLH
ncbi:hypothetical protein B1B01_25140 [Priestia filamentosa]|nr:hypothetical protein B1B01_25140 [Priestia filamentosa]